MSASHWLPGSGASEAVPWDQVDESLRVVQRWPSPHLLRSRLPVLPRRAAVAVLLWGGPDGAREVVLVRRGDGAPQHGGEMAFPGGMVETWDRDLQATARRELAEELGVEHDLWELGCFPDGVTRGGTRLTPVFLRWEAAAPRFQLSSELQDVLRLPLVGLLHAPWSTQTLTFDGVSLQAPRLELALAPVWGATARVLKTWLDVLSSVRNR